MLSSINQIIKGHLYDFSSMEVIVNGVSIITSWQEVTYDWSCDVGELRGNGSAMVKGRTRGEFSFTGNLSLAKSDAQLLQAALAAFGLGGFGEAAFDLVITYSEPGQGKPTVDTLVGCRLVGGSNSHSRQPDPLVVSYDLNMLDQLYDGLSPVSAPGGGGIAGIIGGLLP